MICKCTSRRMRTNGKRKFAAHTTKRRPHGNNSRLFSNQQRRPMAFSRNPPLDERIEKLRAEIDAFIDARAEEVKKTCEGVPVDVIRNLITARGGGCQCQQYLEIKKQDETAATLNAQLEGKDAT